MSSIEKKDKNITSLTEEDKSQEISDNAKTDDCPSATKHCQGQESHLERSMARPRLTERIHSLENELFVDATWHNLRRNCKPNENNNDKDDHQSIGRPGCLVMRTRSNSLDNHVRNTPDSFDKQRASKQAIKSVHFADSDGLQLATIISRCSSTSSIISTDELLREQQRSSILWRTHPSAGQSYCKFFRWHTLSGPNYDVIRNFDVSTNYPIILISLEGHGSGELRGIVQINHKIVTGIDGEAIVRYTRDDWRTYFDETCEEIETSERVGTSLPDQTESPKTSGIKQLKFSMFPPYYLDRVDVLLAVCYRNGSGYQVWDNNDGRNYHMIRERNY